MRSPAWGAERVENGALWNFSSVTLRSEGDQHALEPFQILNFSADLDDMRLSHVLHLSTGEYVPSGKAEKGTDLIEREPQLARAADKGEPFEVAFTIDTLATLRARRRRHDGNALVVANCLDVNAGCRRQPANREFSCAGVQVTALSSQKGA
jgi:hypothetical protein